ncbi:uncharacterized protein LOC108865143 [Galendromus occidentalis]|uniref:Uncharacterized protein LOC108865143 n=1 Tax=Galendromus occidentalis TaxID=34638 RepID=A0AAJ7L6J4_9ACAR|nr:uncharacterized protein LOC108865143 [Galendromus occidentalis]
MFRNALSTEKRAAIVALGRAGHTFRDIARLENVSLRGAVTAVKRHLGTSVVTSWKAEMKKHPYLWSNPREARLEGRIACQKPFLRPKNREKRLAEAPRLGGIPTRTLSHLRE